MSMTAEQKFFCLTEALESAAIAEDKSSTEYGYNDLGEAMAKLAECRLALLQYFRERDTSIADLEQAVADSAVEIARLQAKVAERDATIASQRKTVDSTLDSNERLYSELAELRKPVAVERNEDIEAIRSERRASRSCLLGWTDDAMSKALSAYDALAQDHARGVSAHDAIMAEMRGLRERLEAASAVGIRQESLIMQLQDRERQLQEQLEALTRTRAQEQQLRDYAGKALVALEFRSHDESRTRGVGIARDLLRAALSQPQEPPMAPCDAQALISQLTRERDEAREALHWLSRNAQFEQMPERLYFVVAACSDAALAQPQAAKFCSFQDCDGDPAPGSTLCQGHIDENARIAAEERQRGAQPQGERTCIIDGAPGCGCCKDESGNG